MLEESSENRSMRTIVKYNITRDREQDPNTQSSSSLGFSTDESVPFSLPSQQQQILESTICRPLLLDELLSQADVQQYIIQDLSNFCDVVEAMCKAEEEESSRQSLIVNLSSWENPHSLLASLSEDDYN